MAVILILVAVAGAVGGLLNILMEGTTVLLPSFVTANGQPTLVPNALGTLLIGAIAGVLSFALYGPASMAVVYNSGDSATSTAPLSLTLGTLAGALLIGFSGGKWVQAESQKQLNHATAVIAAQTARDLASRGSQDGTLNLAAPKMPALDRLIEKLGTGSSQQSYAAAVQVLDKSTATP